MEESRARKANVELLRIVAMLMIVSHHFAVHGGFDVEKMGSNGVIVSVLSIGGKIGVNVFILISGYYSSFKEFPIKKILKLLAITVFYSVVLYVVSVLVGVTELRKKELLYAVFPQFFGKGYWFVIIYLELCVLMPILNRIFDVVTKREMQTIIIVMLSLLCVFPQLFGNVLKVNDFGFSTLTWYILVYILGAYLKKYGCCLYQRKALGWMCLILSITIFGYANIVKSLIQIGSFENKKGYLEELVQIFSHDSANGILPVIISVMLLICFQSLDVSGNKWLYKISSATFGVYLLHDNKNFSQYIWNNICGTQAMFEVNYFGLYALSCILGVFSMCSIVEILRSAIVEKIRQKAN